MKKPKAILAMKNKVIFLDRDGTINKEVNYLYRTDDFKFIPKATKAIKNFHHLGYQVMVITNQAGVAKGYYGEDDIKRLHAYLDELLKKEATYIDAYYYCPHHPAGIIKKYSYPCPCRKPNTGMLEKAFVDYPIDRENSILIGDKESDIDAGKRAGIGRCILVRSGHPINESDIKATEIYDDIFEVSQILKKESLVGGPPA